MRSTRGLFSERLAILTLGVYLAGGGLARLAAGRITYFNYLHIRTSSASAVAVGVMLLALGTVGWKRLSQQLQERS